MISGLVSIDRPGRPGKSSIMVAKARRNLGRHGPRGVPGISLHGLSMDINPDIMCTARWAWKVAAFKQACIEHNRIWGCFSIMEFNPDGLPLQFRHRSSTTHGELLKLYYRKLHPWIPVEPWTRRYRHFPSSTARAAPSWRSSSAMTACSRRWRANAPTRAPRS